MLLLPLQGLEEGAQEAYVPCAHSTKGGSAGAYGGRGGCEDADMVAQGVGRPPEPGAAGEDVAAVLQAGPGSSALGPALGDGAPLGAGASACNEAAGEAGAGQAGALSGGGVGNGKEGAASALAKKTGSSMWGQVICVE